MGLLASGKHIRLPWLLPGLWKIVKIDEKAFTIRGLCHAVQMMQGPLEQDILDATHASWSFSTKEIQVSSFEALHASSKPIQSELS